MQNLKQKLVLTTLAMLCSTSYAGDSAHVFARTWINSVNGQPNRGISIGARHQMFISNPAYDHDMTYTWTYELCPWHRECYRATFTKTLKPQTIYTEFHNSGLGLVYDKTGQYPITAKTIVKGEYNEYAEQTTYIEVH